MEDVTLASQTVSLLLPYLAQAGRKVAERIGEDLWNQFRRAAGKLFRSVKHKFAADPKTAADLSQLEQDPGSRGRQLVVEEALAKFIDEDHEFAQELDELVTTARHAGGDTITQTVSISYGTVENVTQIGKIQNGN